MQLGMLAAATTQSADILARAPVLHQPTGMHMWVTFGIITIALVLYALEKMALEVTSLIVLSALLVFFHLFPLMGTDGEKLLTSGDLLLGFANPALVAVMALLILGQAVVRTGSLNEIAHFILRLSRNSSLLALIVTLFVVMFVSAVLNNTPVVVIFIPIMAAMAKQMNISVSRVMMPLSYAAILGGMTTMIGSSTNLLVAGELKHISGIEMGFFDFLIPGSLLACIGLVYVVFIAPLFLKDRASLKDMMGEDGRQFIAQLEVEPGSNLIGQKIIKDTLEDMPEINIRMIQRREHAYLPPFDKEMVLRSGDTLVVAATRRALTDMLAERPDALLHQFPEMTDETNEDEVKPAHGLSIAEVIVAPASRMIGLTLEQIGFRYHYHSIVLGIQRGQRIIRARLTEIRLAAGDVLLVMGKQEDVFALRDNKDVLLMEWSTEELPNKKYARLANAIFFSVIGLAALDVLPITVSALIGATLIIISGCLNVRQALRTLDSQIVFMVAVALAMSNALEATGGAAFIADGLTGALAGYSATFVMSALFLIMVIFTNVLSNNASALLFTPIAYNAALITGADPLMFIYAVIFACNCSFITPIGYQTNLLVMGPGHYKFVDFVKAGVPLALIIWVTYTVYAQMVYQ